MNPLVLFFILMLISFLMFVHLIKKKLGTTWIIVLMMFIYFLILRHGIKNEHKNLQFNK